MTKTPPLPSAVADALEELNEVQAKFLLIYEGNGYNGTAAYKATHPECKSDGAARVGAVRMLTNANVKAALKATREAMLAEHGMDAAEATALVAMRARADLAGAFDDNGVELPFQQWPKTLRVCIKGRKSDGTIQLVDPQRATETILQMLGKLRHTIDLNSFDHSGYLAEANRLAEERANGRHTEEAQPQGLDRQRRSEEATSARSAAAKAPRRDERNTRRADHRARKAVGKRRPVKRSSQ